MQIVSKIVLHSNSDFSRIHTSLAYNRGYNRRGTEWLWCLAQTLRLMKCCRILHVCTTSLTFDRSRWPWHRIITCAGVTPSKSKHTYSPFRNFSTCQQSHRSNPLFVNFHLRGLDAIEFGRFSFEHSPTVLYELTCYSVS